MNLMHIYGLNVGQIYCLGFKQNAPSLEGKNKQRNIKHH